jgi:hypothetical protein
LIHKEEMNGDDPMKYLLIALLAVACIGSGGCSQLEPLKDVTDLSSHASSPSEAEIKDGLHSQGQHPEGTKLMLPIVVDQSILPGEVEATVDIHCTETDPHPIGQRISEGYGISYQQTMTWFCSGYSFENILVALETSAAADFPADTLLQMSLEKEWEEIWVEIGFIENR